MKYSIQTVSNVGLVRENNEDMVLVNHHFVRDDCYTCKVELSANDRYMVALADGMGGHNCGEVASSDVLQNLDFFFGDMPSGLDVQGFNVAVQDWLQSISHTINAKGHTEPRYSGMGTTLVAFVYYEGHFYWLNCGDSRVYQWHEGKLSQLSTDHSWDQITGQTVHSHLITNCIGGGCKNCYIDIFDCSSTVSPGDTIMLCSDGLTDMIDDSQISDILRGGGGADELCESALEQGGVDNISVSVIRIS